MKGKWLFRAGSAPVVSEQRQVQSNRIQLIPAHPESDSVLPIFSRAAAHWQHRYIFGQVNGRLSTASITAHHRRCRNPDPCLSNLDAGWHSRLDRIHDSEDYTPVQP
jgi:hypothetical protein